MTVQITGLDPTTGLDLNDLMITKKGSEDLRATLNQLATLVNGQLTGSQLLTLLLGVDTNTSTLNANFLQGNDAAYFADTSSLTSGTLADARLPNGTLASTVVSTSSKYSINLPSFLFGGQNIKLQWGTSNYYVNNKTISVTFQEPFASGLTNANEPIILVTPQCRENGAVQTGTPSASPLTAVEVDVRLQYASVNGFLACTRQVTGSGADTARANWFAIGKY